MAIAPIQELADGPSINHPSSPVTDIGRKEFQKAALCRLASTFDELRQTTIKSRDFMVRIEGQLLVKRIRNESCHGKHHATKGLFQKGTFATPFADRDWPFKKSYSGMKSALLSRILELPTAPFSQHPWRASVLSRRILPHIGNCCTATRTTPWGSHSEMVPGIESVSRQKYWRNLYA